MAKKYLVGENVAFTSEGNIFKTGDEISKRFFSDAIYFDKLLMEGKIISVDKDEAKAEKKAEKEAEKEAKAEQKAEEKKEKEESKEEKKSEKDSDFESKKSKGKK